VVTLKISTLSFHFYADSSFIPECPEIPQSERIDCTPGQVVTEVREMGSLLVVHWVLFKRN
jgi:maltase-glucoamylase